MSSKIRAVLFGTLVMMMVGAFASAMAFADAGPFWHHRANSGEGAGAKIEENSPEQFQGEGGNQTFLSKVGTTEIELTSPNVQAKGIIYNDSLQGVLKVQLKYGKITIVKPSNLPECKASVGTNNTVNTDGDLDWKYRGNPEELTGKPQKKVQGPEIQFLPSLITAQEKTLPKETFAQFHFLGKCGVLTNPTNVTGSAVGFTKPAFLEEWGKNLVLTTQPGELEQHDWDGVEFQPYKTGLFFGGNAASLEGETKVNAATQEISVFEK